jgi:CBS domain containing-hemolysin-like protein
VNEVSGESWGELIVAAAALAVMAVAAALEASAALISRHRLRELAEERGRQRTVQALLDPRRSLVASLRVVEAIAIAIAASLLTTVTLREWDTAEHVVAVVIVGAVFLLFGQALPRVLANARPERVALLLVGAAGLLALLARPLTWLVDETVRGLSRLMPGGDGPPAVGAEAEFRSVALEDHDHGLIEPAEREMIDNVLHLEETTARDIMVPRVDIIAIEEAAPLSEIVATITRAGHSRLPVYRESIDHVVGVLYAKDLLPFVVGTTRRPPLSLMLRPAHIVPESKRIDDLLTELRRNRIHIAIVADEYGGTAGLVTIEDILEEIVGEIEDEYDTLPPPLLERVGDDEVLADGRVPIADVAELLGLDLGDDAGGTAAGFVHEHLERLPSEGDRVEAAGMRIEVLAVEGHRLRRLRATRIGDQPVDAAGEATAAGEPARPGHELGDQTAPVEEPAGP